MARRGLLGTLLLWRAAEEIEKLDDLSRLDAVGRAFAFVKAVPLDKIGEQQAVFELQPLVEVLNRHVGVGLCAVLEGGRLVVARELQVRLEAAAVIAEFGAGFGADLAQRA